jgi:hypothetical protein
MHALLDTEASASHTGRLDLVDLTTSQADWFFGPWHD